MDVKLKMVCTCACNLSLVGVNIFTYKRGHRVA